MKSITARVLSVLLASIILLSAASCGETAETPGETTGDNGETLSESDVIETEAGPAVEKANYNTEFNAIYCVDIFQEGYYFVEEDDRTPGNELEDKIYERALAVEEYLGVDIVGINGGTHLEYGTKVANSVTAGDDTYQLVLTHPYINVANFVTENQIRPFNDFDSINLDASYWNANVMNSLSIQGKMYYGYGDFCLSNCYVIAFNKDMVNEYQNVVGDLYEQVIDKTWTLDKLIEYTSLVSKDNGDGVWNEEDTYGFTGYAWVPLISFQTASDIPIVKEDGDGELYISPMVDNAEKIVDLDEKLLEFVSADYTYMWSPGAGYNGPTEPLQIQSGRVMFQALNIFDFITVKEFDIKVGVLPYPKWDEAQEDYKTLNWNGLMAIPTTVQDPKMVGDVIEMLGYFSADVTTAFYENLLGLKVAEAPQDAQMLDIIWNSQVSDIGLAFSGVSPNMDKILYAIPHHITASTPAYATYVKQNTRNAERKLKQLYAKDTDEE